MSQGNSMQYEGIFAIRGDLDGKRDNAISNLKQYIEVTIKGEQFFMDVALTNEIQSVPIISYVPNSPDVILGVINLRGEIIPVTDLRKLIFDSPTTLSANDRIILIRSAELSIGFIVDAINNVKAIPENELENNNLAGSTKASEFVSHIWCQAEQITAILDVESMVQKICELSHSGQRKISGS